MIIFNKTRMIPNRMNLAQILKNIDYSKTSLEQIAELINDSQSYTNQFKLIILKYHQKSNFQPQSSDTSNPPILYQILLTLVNIPSRAIVFHQISIQLLEYSNYSNLLFIFKIISNLLVFPQYSSTLLIKLLQHWKNNIHRIVCLTFFNILIQSSAQQIFFKVIFQQIVTVFPPDLDMKKEKEKSRIVNCQVYFDTLVSEVLEFLILSYQRFTNYQQIIIDYFVIFIGVNNDLSLKILEIVHQFLNYNSLHDNTIAQNVINVFISKEILDQNILQKLLSTNILEYCKTISSNVKSLFFARSETKMRQLQNIVQHMCFCFHNAQSDIINYHLVQWLRLLQLHSIIQKENRYNIIKCILEVVKVYFTVIKKQPLFAKSIQLSLINNIPLSIEVLIEFWESKMLSEEVTKQIPNKMRTIENLKQKQILWVIFESKGFEIQSGSAMKGGFKGRKYGKKGFDRNEYN